MKSNHPNSNKGAFLLFLIFLILISVTVGLALSLRVNAVDENLESDRVIKTLVVMEDKNRVLFTDVFIYYPVSQRGALINILGNTGAIFSSLGRVDSIDSVYLEKGIEAYKSEIENLVGQTIPFYIVLNFSKFGELTDILGGMKVFIPSPVDAKNDEGERWLLPSGVVSLDGDKIQTYLNYERSDESDDDLIERRQNVLLAFFAALSRNSNIIHDKKSFASISKRMSSNLGDKELHRLVSVISQVDSEHLTPQTITGSRRNVDGKTLYHEAELYNTDYNFVTLTTTNSYFGNNTLTHSYTSDGVTETVTFSSIRNRNANYIEMNDNSYLTISIDSGTICGMVIYWTNKNNTVTASTGSYSESNDKQTGYWTGESNEVRLTIGRDSQYYTRITKIAVTYKL